MTDAFAFTPDTQKQAETIVARYPKDRSHSAVMPLLDLAQRQHGWLPQDAIEYVADYLDMPKIRVMEVATFYTMYKLRPVGRHHLEVCTNLPCWLRGSDGIVAACKSALGVGFGETTEDGAFSLAEAECLGACVNAPMMQIGDHYYEDLTPENTAALIETLRRGETPAPGSQTGRQTSAPSGGLTTLKGNGQGGAD